jgi:hypothetical protein
MAEMTQEMYGATGRVGNKTYYRVNGKTVSREIVTPKNPKTDAQTIQRVIAAQVGKSYNKFRNIVDHSFEGVTNGFNSMNNFRKLNMRKIRERATEIQQGGSSLAQFYNFQPVGSTKWVPGPLILAQGQLRKIVPQIGLNTSGVYIGAIAIEGNTYGDVINALGAKRGDQLTFIGVCKFNDEYQVNVARIILDPRNADGSGAPLSTAFVTNGAIVSPSWKNDGSFDLIGVRGSDLEFKVGPGVQVACAVIASRKSGEDWLRSNANLVVSEEACGNDLCSLWDAMAASYQNSSLDLESEHYLNNAGVGGGQGSEGQGTGGSTGGNTGGNTGGTDTPGGNTGGTTGGGSDNGGGGADPDDPENSED